VLLAGGERIHYDKLVIATGARPKPSPILLDCPNIFSLYSVSEARRLREFLDSARPRRAAVIGAGYIGLEAADVLHSRGLQVTVFERASSVLGRPDPGLTAAVRKALEQAGMELRLEAKADCGGAFDLAVLAAGLSPDVSLAAEAGVRLGPTAAIATDEHMETNLAGVYAAGDCAEAVHIVTGRPVWIPLGATANRMGRVAGACAAGARDSFRGVVGTSAVKIAGMEVGMTGLCLEEARKEGFDAVAAAIEAPDRAKYFHSQTTRVELVAERRSGRLLGGTVAGSAGVAGRTNVIAAALTAGLRVQEFEQLDLVYTPPMAPVADPLLLAAHQLLKLLD
jgi:NADPH-dependent 2,4-dienoyl-CoA reductase/sulfur reductase-like enzyme